MTISLETHQNRIDHLESRTDRQDQHLITSGKNMGTMVESMERMFARITQLEEQVKTLTTQADTVIECGFSGPFEIPLLGATNNTKGMGESK